MFEKTGVKCRSEEITMIAEKIVEHGVDKHIGAMKAIEFCAEEADRHAWTLVGSRFDFHDDDDDEDDYIYIF